MAAWEVYVTAVAAVLIAVVNIICILLIVRTHLSRQSSNVALCGLLFAHFLQGISVMPLYALKRADVVKEAYMSRFMCDSFRFTYMITNYGSCLCLLVLTVDRLISARFPLYYHVHMGWRTVAVTLCAVWTYVITLCTIPFMRSGQNSEENCSYTPQKEWVIFMLVAHTLCPFIFVLVSYIYIFKKAKALFKKDVSRQSDQKTLSSESSSGRERRHSRFTSLRNAKAQWNAAITSFVIVICYILCWGPSFLFYFIEAVCPSCFSKEYLKSDLDRHLSFLIKFLTFLDGFLAPLIYCAKNRTFRELFYKQARSLSLTSQVTS